LAFIRRIVLHVPVGGFVWLIVDRQFDFSSEGAILDFFLYRQSSFTIFPCLSQLYLEQCISEIYSFLNQMSKRYNKIGGLAPDALRLSNGSDKNVYTGIVALCSSGKK